jgi:hypothetical protein
MPIVGFEFTKIHVEKQETAKGKININNNVGIIDIKKSDLTIGETRQHGLKFIFSYKSLYEPGFASIELQGNIHYLTDEKNAKEILDNWTKEKKLTKTIAEQIVNTILSKSNVESIILSNTVNLPPPVPMPKVNVAGPVMTSAAPKKEEKEKPSKK